MEDCDASGPADAAAFQLLKEQLDEAIAALSERERKILKLCFGLEDGCSRSLEAVGRELNVTRERIRQIEAAALQKMRQGSHIQRLRDFLQ